jgi:branched-chain amino acid aminotransferase
MLQEFNEKNRDLLININGRLAHRDEAGVSPFDSAVQGGDAVWEGLRVYDGRIFKLREHLARLRGSALALAFAGTGPVVNGVLPGRRDVLHRNDGRAGPSD